MQFKISKELILQIEELILSKKDQQLEALLNDMHHADIAEILDELDFDEATYIFKILDSEKTAEILLELEDDLRENILSRLSPKEIAEELDELDTDDAADIIAELSTDIKNEVISELIDVEHAKDIVDLLRYDEDTAGGLMGKELVKVNENWNVLTCVKEMRIQAENVSRVHSIYVVDDENRLKGRLSLKDLLTTSTKTPISEVYIPKVDYVRVDTEDVEVARIMQKYDLEAIPVVDELGRLVGRITIDDIVDVIKDEADKDYQLAAGISQDVEADDSILELTKARLPWLVLALLGGFISVRVLGLFEGAMTEHGNLFFFTPLIAAMAGNVGVQSSAIIVQGLANNTLSGSLFSRLIKEISLSLLNGVILASILFIGSHFLLNVEFIIGVIVTSALISVIIIASLIGTFVPLLLNKFGIDPALATGPFITTSNDICGILIYFSIAKLILGF
ncbi:MULTISPECIES: magnesium transporter [Flavobacterium]|jgi:magnesium transporter|uniref:Magnesium transporter MgtE n=1 Tax=Flavobacterium lindanitolerans TaxID=428988 RepID=A0A497VC00_9FLAO|nr:MULTISPECIES: magnesium transporter [Flavobacterium]PZQ92369.1 MAG: magnesium transporter [Flavobacterium johnsoniae]KQS46346.1 magnesium transporter [Flavobacterium sp. Leaf359]MBL7868445.1 magnesium transporter [Flavobacterium lindanitolerans]MDQ7959147.1 magnesium transporter [Flavobacterium lindanitolerans]OJX51173.1 MAG: magnesium transporter [Flavobacterium sp. 38-13]